MEARDTSSSTFSTGSCASNGEAAVRQSNGFQFGCNRCGHTDACNQSSMGEMPLFLI